MSVSECDTIPWKIVSSTSLFQPIENNDNTIGSVFVGSCNA